MSNIRSRANNTVLYVTRNSIGNILRTLGDCVTKIVTSQDDELVVACNVAGVVSVKSKNLTLNKDGCDSAFEP